MSSPSREELAKFWGSEDEDQRTVTESGGLKNNAGKARYSLLDREWVPMLIQLLEVGARKYEAENWKKRSVTDYSDAIFRHYTSMAVERDDADTGLPHAICIAVNALFVEYLTRGEE